MSTLFNLLLAFVLTILGTQVAEYRQSAKETETIKCAEHYDYSTNDKTIMLPISSRITKN